MSAEKVRRFLKELRAVKGARYGWSFVKPGDTHLPYAEPMYTHPSREFSPAYVKQHGVNCTGLGNQALGRMGLPVPKDPTGRFWPGGTPAWFRALAKRREITRAEVERGFPVGTVLMADYIDDRTNQGHIVWVSTPMKNGKQMTIGSDDADPGPGTPGVTENRSVREAIQTFKLTHAGETPGIGVLRPGEDAGSEEPDGHVRDGFDVADLRAVMPLLPLSDAQRYFPHLVAAMEEFEINTLHRAAHFLAQIGYESGQLRWWEEFGGPGKWYAPYYGRGPIMLTHRDNYAQIGRMIGQPLVEKPGIIGAGGNPTGTPANPRQGLRAAAAFWKSRDLNEIADQGDAGFNRIMTLVLGTSNHPSRGDRYALYERAKKVLPKTMRGVGEMSFRKAILAHAANDDGALAHDAAAVLYEHDIQCTVADGSNLKAAIAQCQSEPVGEYDFVVIGKPAKDMFPDELKKYIGRPPDESDYRDAVGEDLDDTIDKLARVLDGIASRKDVSADLGDEFMRSLQETGRARRRKKQRDEKEERRIKGRDEDGKGVADLDDVPDTRLTDKDLEEIGKEALEFFSIVSSLTEQGGSRRKDREEY